MKNSYKETLMSGFVSGLFNLWVWLLVRSVAHHHTLQQGENLDRWMPKQDFQGLLSRSLMLQPVKNFYVLVSMSPTTNTTWGFTRKPSLSPDLFDFLCTVSQHLLTSPSRLSSRPGFSQLENRWVERLLRYLRWRLSGAQCGMRLPWCFRPSCRGGRRLRRLRWGTTRSADMQHAPVCRVSNN